MNKAKLTKELRALLDASESTAFFLEGVVGAVEQLYTEADTQCPEGFSALDQAVAAFEAAEDEAE